MDLSFKTIMYVVFGIIYLIYQARKNAAKKRKMLEEKGQQSPDQGVQNKQEKTTREIYEPVEKESPASLEDLMDQFFPEPKPEHRKEVIKPKKDLVPYKEATAVLEDEEDDHMDHFDAYDHEIELDSKWSVLLQSDTGAKDAFIASEIFNKKY